MAAEHDTSRFSDFSSHKLGTRIYSGGKMDVDSPDRDEARSLRDFFPSFHYSIFPFSATLHHLLPLLHLPDDQAVVQDQGKGGEEA